MKFNAFKISLLCFILCSLVACNKQAKDANSDSDTTNFYLRDSLELETDHPKVAAFKAFVQDIDSSDVNSSLLAVEFFKKEFAGQRPGLCDTAFVVLQSLLDSIEVKLNLKMLDDTTDYSSLYMETEVPQKVKKYQALLQRNGFKISTSEGMAYVEQDRAFMLQQISQLMTEPMKAYLTQIEMENREGFVQDAYINIPAQKHVDRLIWYENFIKNNQTFVLIENCKNYRKAYLTYLMSGFDNSPLYDDEEKMMLTEYYSTAYKYLIKTYPDSETTQWINPYYDAIKQKQKAAAKDIFKKYVIKGLIYDL